MLFTIHVNYMSTYKCLIICLQLCKFKIFRVADFDYGHEKIRFVASPDYRKVGPRFDDVEISLEGENDHPASIVCFLGSKREVEMSSDDVEMKEDSEEDGELDSAFLKLYAIVHYYDVTHWNHPVLQQPRCRRSDKLNSNNYHILSVESFLSHVHMVPDFDDTTGLHHFWDRVVTKASGSDALAI